MSDKTNEIILSEIRPMQLGRAAAEGHAEVLTDLVKSGEVNALDMATRLKHIISVCEQTIASIQGDCISDAESYAKGEKIIVNNAIISVAETGVKYDYAGTGDPEWEHLDRTISHLAEQKKKRETFLKALDKAEEMKVDNRTVRITPPTKTSSRSVKITFQP
jgi:hypothetical protein